MKYSKFFGPVSIAVSDWDENISTDQRMKNSKANDS